MACWNRASFSAFSSLYPTFALCGLTISSLRNATIMTKDLAVAASPVARVVAGRNGEDAKFADGEEVAESTSISSHSDKRRFATIRDNDLARRVWNVVSWTPKRCRWDPEDPPKFSLGLNLLFGFVRCSFSRFRSGKNQLSLQVKMSSDS